MTKSELKPYIGFDRAGGPEEAICLIFAHNSREARTLAVPILMSWGCEFIDCAVWLMRHYHNLEYIYTLGDHTKLATNVPHVVESLDSCPTCGNWGSPLNEDGKTCKHCNEDGLGGNQP